MTTGHYLRHPSPTGARRSTRENNFFLVMVGCSLAVHGIAALLFSHNPASPVQHRAPTVYVDLVMDPVANPQRGSASVAKPIATPVATQKQSEVVTRITKKEVAPKKTASKAPAEKAEDIGPDIAKMRQRVEDQETQMAIAAMRRKPTPAPQAASVAGSATGTGDEAGGQIGAWLKVEVKSKWTWTERKYKDLNAKIEIEFDASGKLSGYRILHTSGEARFDKSLLEALTKLEPLPKKLRKPYKETILFNLEDLQKP